MPAEWEPQKSVWIAWPYNKNDWPGLYQYIPKVILKIICKISKNQKVNLIINKKEKNIKKLIKLNKIKNVNYYYIKTDRIWLRDSGPIFIINKKTKKKLILNFRFNGWSKYNNYKNDNKINYCISKINNIKKIDPIIKKDFPALTIATDEHFETEFHDLKLAIKVVNNIEEAISHINKFSSGHTEAILTESTEAADLFTSSIDSSVLFVNSSTRFTDGEMFGFGAEIGISTQKLHVRGPMGLEALTSEKYVVKGNGQIRK